MKCGFTLIGLIVVIIIVGILAAVGMTQYSLIVEKSRTAEAKIRIGTMRQLAYQFYLENGSLVLLQNADLGVDNTCASTGYYRYVMLGGTTDWRYLAAYRCTSGGKTPNALREYSTIWFIFRAQARVPGTVVILTMVQVASVWVLSTSGTPFVPVLSFLSASSASRLFGLCLPAGRQGNSGDTIPNT